jgi:lamin B
VSELSRLQTIVGFDPAQFYRTELERAIRDIRGDFEQLNQEQKRELEEWYRIKTEEVEKEVAKEREFQRVSNTGLSAEESNNLKVTHTESQREYVELQRRHGELSARLRELEELLEQSKTSNQITLVDRDREISTLREKISELMATYDELMSRKTSLEFEINTYRRLLECEETRIKTNHAASQQQQHASFSMSQRAASSSGGVGVGGLSAGSVITSAVSSSSASAVSGSVQNSQASVVNAGQQQQQQQPGDQTGGSRTSFSQRGSSTELTSETITKRMQVQRTSKGNLFEEY